MPELPFDIPVRNFATSLFRSYEGSFAGNAFVGNRMLSRNAVWLDRQGLTVVPIIVFCYCQTQMRVRIRAEYTGDLQPITQYVDITKDTFGPYGQYTHEFYSPFGFSTPNQYIGDVQWNADVQYWYDTLARHQAATDSGAYGRTSPRRNAPIYKPVVIQMSGPIYRWAYYLDSRGVQQGWILYEFTNVGNPPFGTGGRPRGVSSGSLPLTQVDSFIPTKLNNVPDWPYGPMPVMGISRNDLINALFNATNGVANLPYYFQDGAVTNNYKAVIEYYCDAENPVFGNAAGSVLFRDPDGSGPQTSIWRQAEDRLSDIDPDIRLFSGGRPFGWLHVMADEVFNRLP